MYIDMYIYIYIYTCTFIVSIIILSNVYHDKTSKNKMKHKGLILIRSFDDVNIKYQKMVRLA